MYFGVYVVFIVGNLKPDFMTDIKCNKHFVINSIIAISFNGSCHYHCINKELPLCSFTVGICSLFLAHQLFHVTLFWLRHSDAAAEANHHSLHGPFSLLSQG